MGRKETNLRNPCQEPIRVPPPARDRREEPLHRTHEVTRDREGVVEFLTSDEAERGVEDVVEVWAKVVGGEVGDLNACRRGEL
jgi:hypothetical protein